MFTAYRTPRRAVLACLTLTCALARATGPAAPSESLADTPPSSAIEGISSLSAAERNARLHSAVREPERLQLVRALLAAGADPLDQLSLHNPPLIAAIRARHAAYADAMLDARPDLCAQAWRGQNEATTVGMVALYHAVDTRQPRLALRLLQKERVRPSSWRPFTHSGTLSVLGLATRGWDTDLVRTLVDAGATFDPGEGFFILLEEYANSREFDAQVQESRTQTSRWRAEVREKNLAHTRTLITNATDPAKRARLEKRLKAQEAEPAPTAEDSEPTTLRNIRLLAATRAPGKNIAPGLNDLRPDDRTPLSLAVERGWPEVVAILVAAGADLRQGLVKGRRVHDYAAADPVMLRALGGGAAAEHPTTGSLDGADYVAAIHRGDDTRLAAAALTPALLAFRDPIGKTLLHHAIEVGNDALALRLIEAGADIEAASKGGQTPLAYTAFKSRHEIMRVLLARHARPDGSSGEVIFLPLIAAASTGEAEGVRLLLAAGADPSARDSTGMPVIVSAAMHSPSVEPVRLLVEAGARLDVSVNIHGSPMGPLEAAFVKDHADTLAYLLDRKASWAYAREDGNSPLFSAAEAKAWKCARLLLSRGERDDRALALAEDPAFKAALEDRMQAAGSTVLDDAELWPALCADTENWRARVDAHLAGGGNVNYRAKDWTPLLRVIETGNLEFVRHLLAKGADPKVHPLERYENDPGTLDYLYMGRFHPRALSADEWETYRAALIRLIVPLEPSHGFSNYEWRLSRAACRKSWAEAEAYVAAGVDTTEAVRAVRKTSDLTADERAQALKLLGATAIATP